MIFASSAVVTTVARTGAADSHTVARVFGTAFSGLVLCLFLLSCGGTKRKEFKKKNSKKEGLNN
jgi:hypothetical protein